MSLIDSLSISELLQVNLLIDSFLKLNLSIPCLLQSSISRHDLTVQRLYLSHHLNYLFFRSTPSFRLELSSELANRSQKLFKSLPFCLPPGRWCRLSTPP